MPPPSYEDIADDIRQAISDLVKNKISSYAIGGRNFTYQDLTELADLEQRFRSFAKRDSSGFVTLSDVTQNEDYSPT